MDEYAKAIVSMNDDDDDKSKYSVYSSRCFKKIGDVLNFLNDHRINSNDIVSLLELGGEISPAIFKLIFFDRFKTERYLIVLKKGDRELFSTEDRTLAESKFEEYRSFQPKYDDEYRHVFVLKRIVEWVSGNKIITCIQPKPYPKDVLIQSDPNTNIKSSKDVLIIDHPLLVTER